MFTSRDGWRLDRPNTLRLACNANQASSDRNRLDSLLLPNRIEERRRNNRAATVETRTIAEQVSPEAPFLKLWGRALSPRMV